MNITLKLLLFPEFGRALVGVDYRGIALLDTPVAESLFIALQDALPIASTRKASIYVDQIQSIWGFIPGVNDDPWASDGRELLVWERWLESASEDLLLELIDRVGAGTTAGTTIADWEDADSQFSSAPMLAAALEGHPEVWFSALFFREDLARLLKEKGWAASEENLQAVLEDFGLLLGRPEDFQDSIYHIVQRRLPELALQAT